MVFPDKKNNKKSYDMWTIVNQNCIYLSEEKIQIKVQTVPPYALSLSNNIIASGFLWFTFCCLEYVSLFFKRNRK